MKIDKEYTIKGRVDRNPVEDLKIQDLSTTTLIHLMGLIQNELDERHNNRGGST